MKNLRGQQFPLHIHVSVLFVLMTLALGGLLLGVGYLTSRTLINTMADDMTLRIGRETNGELQRILRPVETVVNVLSLDELSRYPSHQQRMGRWTWCTNCWSATRPCPRSTWLMPTATSSWSGKCKATQSARA